MAVDLAVIIVTWNVRDLVLDALRTLYADLEHSGLGHEVIVVDSASSDQTAEVVAAHFPQVRLIASDTNLGFAGGNNEGLRLLGFGSYPKNPDDLPKAVFLLNPDTITEPGATRQLYDTLFREPDTGVVGARLTYGDGSFQHAAFAFPGLRQLWVEFFPTPGRLIEGRFNGRYPRTAYQSGLPFEVDFMLGATMMLRREVIVATGMFDPRYFMYCEEVDWQWRIRDAGWQILCVPAAHVVHLVGQSTGQIKPRSIINLWTSRLYLFKKHYRPWKNRVARWMVAAGMQIRMWQARKEDPAVIDAYRTVRDLARQS
jgi:hypothetical protein